MSMAHDGDYRDVLVESFRPNSTAGLHGPIHMRPLPNQGLSTTLHVECSKSLSYDHPLGSIFKIRAKLTDRNGGGNYLYSHHKWPFEKMTLKEAKAFIKNHGPWPW